jgi:NTP pyrophosphatase (non-canonical NTP hydrolase)
MTPEQYKSIAKWQDEIFTKATALSCANHLAEEVEELKWALDSDDNDMSVTEEIADCFLLLIGVCNKFGLKYDDIVKIINDKMQINYTRKWGDINNNGYMKHIE